MHSCKAQGGNKPIQPKYSKGDTVLLKVVSAALLAVLCASLFSVYMPLANAQEDDYDCGRYFTGGPGIVQPPEWEYDLLYRWTLDIDDQKYDIRYGGSVKNATANIDRHSIEFDGRSEGTILQLRLPRVLIDSTQDGKDVPFTVLVNGQPSLNATQGVVPSNGDRMICIPLKYWGPVARIEIIGTSIAPEFDSLAIVIASVMVVAIVASRAISAKHSTMPKL